LKKLLSQVKRSIAYYLEAFFEFKKQKVLIIVVYILYNDQKIRKDIQQQVIKKVYEYQNKVIKVIVLGDFNDIRCKDLNQSRNDFKRIQKLSLLSWLENSSMINTFRKLYSYTKKFTRANKLVKSRFDYILVFKNLEHSLICCDIIEANTITNSNHTIVVTKMITGISKRSRATAQNKKLKKKK
jgi:hypothetical protein